MGGTELLGDEPGERRLVVAEHRPEPFDDRSETDRRTERGAPGHIRHTGGTAGALSASHGQDLITVDDIARAVEEFPGNGLEVTSSTSNIAMTVSTGTYAGCSATLTPRGSEVVLEDVVCDEPRTDAPAPEPVN